MINNHSDTRQLERTRYWTGQTLEARDLKGQIADDLKLRWWHNRALHQAFGVAIGYEVTPIHDLKAAITGLEFAPGVAYDCFGRALVLLRTHAIDLPENPKQQPLTLLVRYRETPDFPDPRRTEGVCITCCEDSLAEEHPEFSWTIADPPSPAAGVTLARVTYINGRVRLLPSFTVPTTEPMSRPYLANGSTVPGGTPWVLWKSADRTIGWQVDVDTSAAGFSRVPCYFASLEGFDPVALGLVPNSLIFTHITQPKPDGFRFRIFIGKEQPQVILLALRLIRQLRPQFYVCWLGCESQANTSQCLNPEVQKSCCG